MIKVKTLYPAADKHSSNTLEMCERSVLGRVKHCMLHIDKEVFDQSNTK